jgi:hypothetical protein
MNLHIHDGPHMCSPPPSPPTVHEYMYAPTHDGLEGPILVRQFLLNRRTRIGGGTATCLSLWHGYTSVYSNTSTGSLDAPASHKNCIDG